MNDHDHTELRTQIEGLRADVREDIAELRTDIKKLYSNGISELSRKVSEHNAKLSMLVKGYWVVFGAVVAMAAERIARLL